MFKPNNEAEKIYFAIFGRKIPSSTEAHFDNISGELDKRYSETEISKYRQLVANVADLEALELAARHLGKVPILSEKFKIMVYLAETLPENYEIFINESSSLPVGLSALALSVFRTAFKISKGICLVAVYRV